MLFCYSWLTSLHICTFLLVACQKIWFLNVKWLSAVNLTIIFLFSFCFILSTLSFQGCKSNMGSTEINAEIDWWKIIIGLITTPICFSLAFLFFGNSKRLQIGLQLQPHYPYSTGWNLKISMLACFGPSARHKFFGLKNWEKDLGINVFLVLLVFCLSLGSYFHQSSCTQVLIPLLLEIKLYPPLLSWL